MAKSLNLNSIYNRLNKKGGKYFSNSDIKRFTKEILKHLEDIPLESYYIKTGQKENEIMLEFTGVNEKILIDITQTKDELVTFFVPIRKINSVTVKKDKEKAVCSIAINSGTTFQYTYMLDKDIEFENHIKEIEKQIYRLGD